MGQGVEHHIDVVLPVLGKTVAGFRRGMTQLTTPDEVPLRFKKREGIVTGVHPVKEGEVGNTGFRPWALPAAEHTQENIKALLLCVTPAWVS